MSSCFELSPNVALAYFMFATWYGVMVHSGYNPPPFDWIQGVPACSFIITSQAPPGPPLEWRKEPWGHHVDLGDALPESHVQGTWQERRGHPARPHGKDLEACEPP